MQNGSNFTSDIKAKLYGEEFEDASQQKIIEEVESWKNLQITIFWENLRSIKKKLLEKKQALDFSHFIFPSFENINKKEINNLQVAQKAFNFWEKNETIEFTTATSFYKAYFTNELNLKGIKFKELFDFSYVTINGDCSFSESTFYEKVNFRRTRFKEELNFFYTKFLKDVSFDEASFHNKTVFHKVYFKEESSFSILSSKYRITFFDCRAKSISFKYSRIENVYFIQNHFKYMNLHGVAIQKPFFSDNVVLEAERETFAYIKHFFDERKDYISANHYYSKEMESYQEELFPESKFPFFKKIYFWFNKSNLGDKLVFGFSKIGSNFGQSIFLPLYWIFLMGFLFVGYVEASSFAFFALALAIFLSITVITFFIKKIFKIPKADKLKALLRRATFSLALSGIAFYSSSFFNHFAKVINPLQLLRSKDPYCHGLEFSCLLLKILIAAMVYQFIIAVKRGMKR